jgi:tRNA(Ile)-lysidine synthase
MCIQRVRSVISTHFPSIEKEKKILISFSGGPDSVFLVNVLQTLYPSMVLHLLYFNHQLRPEVIEELQFVKKFSNDHKCLLTIRKIPVQITAKKKKITLEQSGRFLRQLYIKHIMKHKQFKYCLLGHHNDDRIETFMFRLLKGSKGGTSSIKPCINFGDSGYLCRPLLSLYKEEILRSLVQLKKEYLIDSSNNDLMFDRNKIRKSLDQLGMPVNPQYKKHISSFIDYLSESQEQLDMLSGWNDVPKIINDYCARFDLSFIKQEMFLIKWVVSSLFRAVKACCNEREFSYNQTHVESVSRLVLLKDDTIYQLPSGFFCQIVNNVLIIVFEIPKKETIISSSFFECLNFGINVTVKTLTQPPISLLSCRTLAYFGNLNSHSKITVRAGTKDDSFQPFGTSKNVPLRKMMSRLKIPKLFREVMPLFFFDNQLAWIPGYQVSEAFRVTEKTAGITCIEIEEIK